MCPLLLTTQAFAQDVKCDESTFLYDHTVSVISCADSVKQTKLTIANDLAATRNACQALNGTLHEMPFTSDPRADTCSKTSYPLYSHAINLDTYCDCTGKTHISRVDYCGNWIKHISVQTMTEGVACATSVKGAQENLLRLKTRSELECADLGGTISWVHHGWASDPDDGWKKGKIGECHPSLPSGDLRYRESAEGYCVCGKKAGFDGYVDEACSVGDEYGAVDYAFEGEDDYLYESLAGPGLCPEYKPEYDAEYELCISPLNTAEANDEELGQPALDACEGLEVTEESGVSEELTVSEELDVLEEPSAFGGFSWF